MSSPPPPLSPDLDMPTCISAPATHFPPSSTAVTAATTTSAEKDGHGQVKKASTPLPSSTLTITNISIDVSIQSKPDLQAQSPDSQQQQVDTHVAPSLLASPPATATPLAAVQSSNMIFADFYKGPRSPLAKLRQNNPPLAGQLATSPPDWVDDEYADLMSKDKAKQKDAVKRYLTAKIRNDWEFQWQAQGAQEAASIPRQGEQGRKLSQVMLEVAAGRASNVQDEMIDDDDDDGYQVDDGAESDRLSEHDNDDAESVYSVISEDNVNFRPRLEWASELSDDEDAVDAVPSPYRYDSPEAIRTAVRASILEKRTFRRRANREEMTWNEGLACFEARRDAWTGAKTVRVRNKPVSIPSVSPRSPRRFFFRRSLSGSPPSNTPALLPGCEGGSITASDTSSIAKDDRDLKKQGTKDSNYTPDHLLPVETLLPLAQPILPPNNPLRASITPSVYLSLYDKVILNNLQPACPVNLSDMLRACVTGWKRDGEWPPRPAALDPLMAMRKKKQQQQAKRASVGNSETISTARRMSFGLLGRGGDEESRTGKGIRKSLQRAFGLGSSPTGPET
ncbi:hypothetical protein PT974_10162 [Cladobotryum mycophilum]|uniref:Gag1-like clamp domain-containing protein n=1 Tax=Cladobotryum mycophilum TaxID=491253 RepID=A0ABR0S935_9HYPO